MDISVIEKAVMAMGALFPVVLLAMIRLWFIASGLETENEELKRKLRKEKVRFDELWFVLKGKGNCDDRDPRL